MARRKRKAYFKLDKAGVDALMNSPEAHAVADEAGAMFEGFLGDRSESQRGDDNRARTYTMGKEMSDSMWFRRRRAYDEALSRFPVSMRPDTTREGGR